MTKLEVSKLEEDIPQLREQRSKSLYNKVKQVGELKSNKIELSKFYKSKVIGKRYIVKAKSSLLI